MTRPVVGVSLKMYFTRTRTREWLTAARQIVPDTIEFFIAPSYLAIPDALTAFPDSTAAQDVSAEEPGPFTGEISATELAEAGVRYVEIGHAERRHRHGETDAVVAAKCAAALRHGLVPVLCVGEADRGPDAVTVVVEQLRAALRDAPAGRVIIAYEPAWAIGATQPAPHDHIRKICAALRDARREPHDAIIYGGSAGPGLLTHLDDTLDGLFLGRFAHNPQALRAVIDEATTLA